MLRRGWPTVLLIAAIGVGLAALYLSVAPKRYETTATILVSTNNSGTTNDMQLGSQFAMTNSETYADLVKSEGVMRAVAQQIRPVRSVESLEEVITAGRRELTSLIDVKATAGSAIEAASIANTVATTATEVIPTLVPRANRSLISLEVVRSARAPSSALSPDTSRVLALGLVAGLSLGLGITIVSQALDTRLRRPEDLAQLTKAPLLAVLPRPKRAQRAAIVVRDDPASAAVETYRSLRTNLSYLEDGSRRSLLFTGVAEDRVGVQVPVNLAWSIAQAGRRVLLIDLDLRQSVIGDILNLRGRAGIADVLAGEVELEDVVHKTSQSGLCVALSGTTQPSPSDLLSNPVMERVLRSAEEDYDYVVLHAPPLLTFTDAAVVSRVAGQTLVTVSAGHTRALELTTALGSLSNVRVEPLGLVLAGSRTPVGDMSKVRGIWARPRAHSGASPRPVQWDRPESATESTTIRRTIS